MKKNETAKTDLYQLMKNNPTKTKGCQAFHGTWLQKVIVYRWIALVEKKKLETKER